MQKMGLEAIYPKSRNPVVDCKHQVYPYLLCGSRLRDLIKCEAPTFPCKMGLCIYTVIDWYSRYVLSWQLSNTLDMHFCRNALQQALQAGQPDVFNTDQ